MPHSNVIVCKLVQGNRLHDKDNPTLRFFCDVMSFQKTQLLKSNSKKKESSGQFKVLQRKEEISPTIICWWKKCLGWRE